MNAMFDSRGRSLLPSGGPLTPTLAKQRNEMRGDRRLGKLLGGGGGGSGKAEGAAVEAPAAGPGGNYSWGSPLMPWEIAANGQHFIQQHGERERGQEAGRENVLLSTLMLHSITLMRPLQAGPFPPTLVLLLCSSHGRRAAVHQARAPPGRVGGSGDSRGKAAAACCPVPLPSAH